MANEISWDGYVLDEDQVENGYHSLPETALDPQHLYHPTCWCMPELDRFSPEDGHPIWRHRAMN